MKAQKAAGYAILGVLAGTVFCFPEGQLRSAKADEPTDLTAITVETVSPAEDGSYTATVYLDMLPDTGLNALDFAIRYDPALLTVDEVTLLYDTGADAAEAAVDPKLKGTVFHYEKTVDGELWIRWATALKNADYWLREEQAFFTISGTVLVGEDKGCWAPLELAPATRETYTGSGVMNTEIFAGYMDAEGNVHECETSLKNGVVWKPIDETGATLYGDVNLSGRLEIADAVMLQQAVTEQIPLSAAAYANADCEFDGVLSIADVTLMLRLLEREGIAEAAEVENARSSSTETALRTGSSADLQVP